VFFHTVQELVIKLRDNDSEQKAKHYAKSKVIKSLLKVGTFEQQWCILLHVLSDPVVCNIALSIGVNMSDICVEQQIMKCGKKLIQRATQTDNKNFKVSTRKRYLVKAISVAFLPTPTKNDSDPHCTNNRKRNISIRELARILGFSNGTGWRTMTIAESKRGEIADGGSNGWIMLDEDDERTKYSDNLLDSLELWMANKDMVLDNPCKGELVIKCDRRGDIV